MSPFPFVPPRRAVGVPRALVAAVAVLAAAGAQAGIGNGAILIDGGSLYLPATLAGVDVTVATGSLAGNGTVLGDVVLGAAGRLAPGPTAGAGTITARELRWAPDGSVRHRLGADDGDSDHTDLTGNLVRTGTGTYHFAFGDGAVLPTVGTTYTLVSFAGQVGFNVADFSYSYDGAAPGLGGQFSLTDTALLFHVTSLPVSLQSFGID